MTLPQVWFVPAVTSSHSTTSRTTTGDRRVESVPSPNSPLALAPQQYVTLSVPRPQLCRSPATSVRNAWPPVTALGTGLADGPPLEPSWLAALLPQQNAAPLWSTAHV